MDIEERPIIPEGIEIFLPRVSIGCSKMGFIYNFSIYNYCIRVKVAYPL